MNVQEACTSTWVVLTSARAKEFVEFAEGSSQEVH